MENYKSSYNGGANSQDAMTNHISINIFYQQRRKTLPFTAEILYSRQEIKNILLNWGIKSPKATDITKYLIVEPTKIGKSHAFKIVGIKEE